MAITRLFPELEPTLRSAEQTRSFMTSHHSVALALGLEESLQLLRSATELRSRGSGADRDLSRHDGGERGGQLRTIGAGLHIRDTIDFGDDHKNVSVARRERRQCHGSLGST